MFRKMLPKYTIFSTVLSKIVDVNFIVNILNKLCLVQNLNTIAVISQFPK